MRLPVLGEGFLKLGRELLKRGTPTPLACKGSCPLCKVTNDRNLQLRCCHRPDVRRFDSSPAWTPKTDTDRARSIELAGDESETSDDELRRILLQQGRS